MCVYGGVYVSDCDLVTTSFLPIRSSDQEVPKCWVSLYILFFRG